MDDDFILRLIELILDYISPAELINIIKDILDEEYTESGEEEEQIYDIDNEGLLISVMSVLMSLMSSCIFLSISRTSNIGADVLVFTGIYIRIIFLFFSLN